MNIPSRVNPFGYDNSIPLGYARAEFLESTRTQYIDPLHVPTRQFGYEIKVTAPLRPITSSGFIWGCQTSSGGRRLWMQIKPNNQGEVAWGSRTVSFPLNGGLNEQTFSMNYKANNLCILDDVVLKNLWNMGFDPVYHFTLFKSTFTSNTNFDLTIPVRIFFAKFSEGSELIRDIIPALDPTGTPCMFDTVTGQPFLNAGTGQFTAGLTTKQAINLVNLPATGGSLTISLPLEAAFDDNVQDALNAAADKGWTITVQYRESELTTKNIPADFLESTGTQYILLSPIPRTHKLFIDFQILSETGRMMGYYETVDSVAKALMLETYNNISLRCCIDGNYPGIYSRNIHERYSFLFTPKTDNKLEVRSGTTVKTFAFDLAYTPTKEFGLFRAVGSGTAAAKLWEFSNWDENGTLARNLIPALDSTGTPCMHDTVGGQNFYNANTAEGATPFIVGFDTSEKAAISLSKLPITSGSTLTVSLPAAAQDTDTRVPEAIDIATNRGWTIITQYRED